MNNYRYFVFLVACASIAAANERLLQHIPGLENECAEIDAIYNKLHTLTRDERVVVYVNEKGVFENAVHELYIYKFCYDVNVERTAEQKAWLARYNAQKGFDAIGRIRRELPESSPLYNHCARQTGMVVDTLACGLMPYPECGGVLMGIVSHHERLQAAQGDKIQKK